MGLRAISERDTTTALKHFQAALEFDPHNAQVLNTMAYQMALDSQELDYAESLALRALALEPTNPNFLDTLGWILCQRGSPQPAVTLLRAAMFLSREPVPEIAGHIPACASDAVGGSGVPRETSAALLVRGTSVSLRLRSLCFCLRVTDAFSESF